MKVKKTGLIFICKKNSSLWVRGIMIKLKKIINPVSVVLARAGTD